MWITSLYNILKENKGGNHIIFLDYLTGMKIVVPEIFYFQYLKKYLRIRFFGIGLKIGIDTNRNTLSKNRFTRFPNFHKVLKCHQI